MDIKRRFLALGVSGALVVSGLIGTGAVARTKAPKPTKNPCVDKGDAARAFSLKVEGKKATGRFALPAKQPKALVVYAHGFGHTSASWVEHMKTSAKEHGVIAVAMDYRGIKISPDSNKDGLPESRGWNAMAGAEDLIAAAQHFDKKCKSIEQIALLGVSMGGNMSGLAVALTGAKNIKNSDGDPLFDYWLDIEGAVNLTETYLTARAAGPANGTAAAAAEDIEAETGGPIESNPEAYQERTVVARMDDIDAAGLKGVVVVHGVDDGLVPYNQAREIASLLAQNQIPTQMVTIGQKSEKSERDTSATGHAVSNVDPDYSSPLAGHASEKSTTHIVMVTAFDYLWQVLDEGMPNAYGEALVNGG